MDADTFRLDEGFAPADLAAWTALAEKALKGAPLDRLASKTADGLPVAPLHVGPVAPLPAPGVAPFVRGARAVRDADVPWDIRQTVIEADPVSANTVALEELTGAATGLELVIDPTGRCGIAAATPEDFASLIAGVHLDLAGAGLSAPHDGLAAAQALAAAVRGADRDSARIAFNLDPFAALMTTGASPFTAQEGACWAAGETGRFAASTFFRADARAVHEGGGTPAQELAALIAAGIGWLKAGEAEGLSPADVAGRIWFALALDADVPAGIAKVRAARLMWARVLEACGVAAPMRLHAFTSGRMMARRDAWTNMLRTTCAGLAGAVAGADAITVAPFTAALGHPTAFARRIARNTQVILTAESGLGAVADPAGGSFALETLTRDLAAAAWEKLQDIEAAGGLGAVLASGSLQAEVSGARARLEAAAAKRSVAAIGVSEYALIGEAAPEVAPAPEPRAWTAPAAALTASAIAPMRIAAPFERLRDAADGANPSIFLATLGPLAAFTARAGFARTAFEAGGIAALGSEDVHAHDTALAAAFAASGATIACLCGTDAAYSERGAAAAAALRGAGCTTLWLAGRPLDPPTPGVDRHIFAGGDILAELHAAFDALGIAP
jgi:methylmalonyl-CoA mutase